VSGGRGKGIFRVIATTRKDDRGHQAIEPFGKERKREVTAEIIGVAVLLSLCVAIPVIVAAILVELSISLVAAAGVTMLGSIILLAVGVWLGARAPWRGFG
jgi:hypothetical protein